MTRVLLTGFEPFGGERTNPSWQAVSSVAARRDLPYEIVTVELPCVFGESISVLRQAIAQHRPELVVCVGQAGGRADVTPERIAANLSDSQIPDNAGGKPIDEPVIAGGPDGYFSSLPVKACVAAIRASGIPASVSHTAGTYVCNHVFYGLMHLLAGEHSGIRGGFVHVPYSPEQVTAARMSAPSLPVDTVAEALDLLVRSALDTSVDLAVPGGTLH